MVDTDGKAEEPGAATAPVPGPGDTHSVQPGEAGMGQAEVPALEAAAGVTKVGTNVRDQLLAAAEELRAAHAQEVAVSTSRLLNPLLDLWSLASELGPQVAAPVEELLTVYAGPRDLASPAELKELVDRLRQASDLAMV
jgi:hypothetical protein